MIPTTISQTEELVNDFEVRGILPTKTYHLRILSMRVQGLTDGLEAMKQAVFKVLQTERYRYPKIYSGNYGVELWDLIGQPIPYVLPEIQRRITEALTWDERITGVDGYEFEVQKSKVHTTFVVHTIYGEIETELAVNF